MDTIKSYVKGEMDELKEVIKNQDKNDRAEVEKLIKITKDSEVER